MGHLGGRDPLSRTFLIAKEISTRKIHDPDESSYFLKYFQFQHPITFYGKIRLMIASENQKRIRMETATLGLDIS